MRFTKFIITFTTGETETISALGKQEAVILAQAKQIKKGNSFEVSSVLTVGEVQEFTVTLPSGWGTR